MVSSPMPTQPPLDGVPPSPPGAQAGGGPNPSMSQLAPAMQMSGSMQVMSLSLEAAGQAAKLIDLIGQVHPPFAPAAQQLIEMLRGALKATLQQGSASSEPMSQPNVPAMAMPSASPTPGAVQQPLPAMPTGF